MRADCRVYWGSHGCMFARGHEGPHMCECCLCPPWEEPDPKCVGCPPYYGPETVFYGEDAPQTSAR